jgi:hypothetical protein
MLPSLLLAAALAAAPVPAAPVPPPAEAPSSESYQPSGRPSIGFLSAAALRERCEASAPSLVSYCFAYITGVHDTVQAYETWLRMREFCAPEVSAQADMRRAFLTYLNAHPNAASGEAASVIVLAFKDQFPCVGPAGAAKR